MKTLVGAIIGLIGSIVVIILDIKLIHYIFTLIPLNDWTGFIKILIIFIDIWFVAGLCFIPFVLGIFIGNLLEQFSMK